MSQIRICVRKYRLITDGSLKATSSELSFRCKLPQLRLLGKVNSFYLCYEESRASLVQSSFGTRQNKFQHVASHFFHDYEHLKDRCLNVKFIVNIGGPESHHRNWLGFFGLFLRTPCEVSTSLMILLLLSFIFILLLFFFPTKLSFCFKRNFQHGKQ